MITTILTILKYFRRNSTSIMSPILTKEIYPQILTLIVISTHLICITLLVKEMRLTSYYTAILTLTDALNGSIFKFKGRALFISKYSTTDETSNCSLNATFTHHRAVVSIFTIIEQISIILIMLVQILGLQLIKNKLSSIHLNSNIPLKIHNSLPSHTQNLIHCFGHCNYQDTKLLDTPQ